MSMGSLRVWLARLLALMGFLALTVIIVLAVLHAPQGPMEELRPQETPPSSRPMRLVVPAASPSPARATPTATPTTSATPPLVEGNATATASPPPTSAAAVWLETTGNVWCRSGPGLFYDALTTFQTGTRAQVLGQYEDPLRAYWWVADSQGNRCWLPKRYARLIDGETAAVPFITPPPPPPVAFLVGIERISQCRGRYGLTLWVRNEGTRALESVDAKIEGPGGAYHYDIGLGQHNNFEWWLTCDVNGRLGRLLPGETGHVTIATGTRNVSGDPVTVTFKACSEDHLQGQCLERRLLLPVP